MLTNAQTAKRETNNSSVEEEIRLAWLDVYSEGSVNEWNDTRRTQELQSKLRVSDSGATATLEDDVITINFKEMEFILNISSGILELVQ